MSPATTTSTGKLKRSLLKSKFKSDFSFEPEESDHVIWLLYGDAGVKKTSFAFLEAPGPVLTFNFDGRDGPAMKRAVKMGREIVRVRIKLPRGIDKLPIKDSSGRPLKNPKGQEIGVKLMDKFWRTWEEGIVRSEEGELATFCIDTALELTSVMSVAFCGRTTPPKNDYGKTKGMINTAWREIIASARNDAEANLIILDRGAEIWKDNKPTGFFTYKSPSVVNDGVDISANIRLKKNAKGALTDKSEILIVKAGGDLSDIGRIFTEKDWGKEGPFKHISRLQMSGERDEDDGEDETEEEDDDENTDETEEEDDEEELEEDAESDDDDEDDED